MTKDTEKSPQTNEHIKSHLQNYLEYYKSLENPGYGVLITGAWGSGKTHQLKSLLSTEEMYYLSLFGTQTTDEVYSAVFAKMFPIKSMARAVANKADGTELEFPLAKFNVGGLVSGIAGAFLRDEVKADRVLVFDDLERSSIPIKDLLGVFNKYIEHHECRVVVIAHDEKISADLQETKEKVFGQTIQVEPRISEAFDHFAARPDTKEKTEIVRSLKDEILGTFEESETFSLRILKHTMEDLTRLFGTLSQAHRDNSAAMKELTLLFCALSLEIRAGRLKESDLIDRRGAIIRYQMERARSQADSNTPRIYTANDRYDKIDLGSQLLKDQTLTNILIKGIYIISEIHNSLDESLHFAKLTDLPPWLVFMKFDEVSDLESHKAAAQLIAQFDSREIDELGEMIHLFAIRFLLSGMDMISANFEETVIDCKKYLDDLLQQDRLSPDIHDTTYKEGFSAGYQGYAFWVEDAYRSHFSNVLEYLTSCRSKASKKLYPSIALELLRLVASDGALFARKISYTFSGGNTYARTDVLATIPPDDFVQEWMGSPPPNWGYISRGLEQRYAGGELDSSLKAEKGWLIKVISSLDHQHRQAKGIRKKRIERIVSRSLRGACQ